MIDTATAASAAIPMPRMPKERSVTIVFAKRVPSLTDKQARAVVKTWIENGILGRDKYVDPVDRKERSGLVVLKRPVGAR